ncbi:hypothetical protein I4U23_015660 [Adineta vaga]|nr:hypothetical protein I4U23_015660 [Adineta vaga]
MSSSNVTSSSSIQTELHTINSFLSILTKWILPITSFVGVISNILNIYVFTRTTLRKNPCCMYFLSSSVAALIYTIINTPFRTLQAYNIDPTVAISEICKIKYFFTYAWRALTIWFLVLPCCDRFLHSSSNANVRGWSSYKVAFRAIPLTFVFVHLAYLHVPFFYEILLPRRTCAVGNNVYGIFLGIWHLITYGTGPPLLMLAFSLLTIRHIRKRRVKPTTNQASQANQSSRNDRNLLRMVFIQCLVVGSTTTAYAIMQLYTTLTVNQSKTSLQLARDGLFGALVGVISATGHNATFFVFTLTSKMFREQLFSQCRRRN